jgi:hypothetical protein
MIRKSAKRLSEKIMPNQKPEAQRRALGHKTA